MFKPSNRGLQHYSPCHPCGAMAAPSPALSRARSRVVAAAVSRAGEGDTALSTDVALLMHEDSLRAAGARSARFLFFFSHPRCIEIIRGHQGPLFIQVRVRALIGVLI